MKPLAQARMRRKDIKNKLASNFTELKRRAPTGVENKDLNILVSILTQPKQSIIVKIPENYQTVHSALGQGDFYFGYSTMESKQFYWAAIYQFLDRYILVFSSSDKEKINIHFFQDWELQWPFVKSGLEHLNFWQLFEKELISYKNTLQNNSKVKKDHRL
ncbi:hypothetical protein [Echinicola sp. 20G]|uniref:hypothetical protein n=1 Tax=Echinicola sp. 20G TaxID=2781961 RepID=UPI00190FD60B|nr:hypothetical protein [Echinicola sp. 20G]